MLHLSWSPIELIATLLLIGLVSMVLLIKLQKYRKYITYSVMLVSTLVFMSAFDVGVRQSNLGRSNMNADMPNVVTIDKIESTRITANDVKKSFEETVKGTN